MSVELTTAKLFELLGTVYAEVRVLAEENARLELEAGVLKAALDKKEAKAKDKAK